MNTLLKNFRTKAVVAPTRDPANPSQRLLVAGDDVVIRQLNAVLREEALW
jgi:hypothetical protein